MDLIDEGLPGDKESDEEAAGEADSDLDCSAKKRKQGKDSKAKNKKKKRQAYSDLSEPEGSGDYKESNPKPSERRTKNKGAAEDTPASKEESPEQAMPTLIQVCEHWGLNDVDLAYSDNDYSNLTTYKVARVHLPGSG